MRLHSGIQIPVMILLLAVAGIQAHGSLVVGGTYSGQYGAALPVQIQGLQVLHVQPILQAAPHPHHAPVLAAAPAHVLVPYAAGTPLKLLFSQFPPMIEGFVQRVQNYFSTYNNPHLLVPTAAALPTTPAATVPAGSADSGATAVPLTPTTTVAPATTPVVTTTTSTTTTTTTTAAPDTQPPPARPIDNSASTGGLDYDIPQPSTDNEGRYRYDPPSRNPFRYPLQPRFGQSQSQRNGYDQLRYPNQPRFEQPQSQRNGYDQFRYPNQPRFEQPQSQRNGYFYRR